MPLPFPARFTTGCELVSNTTTGSCIFSLVTKVRVITSAAFAKVGD